MSRSSDAVAPAGGGVPPPPVVFLVLSAWILVGGIEVYHLREQPTASLPLVMNEDFTHGHLSSGRISPGWDLGVHGLALSPGRSGTVTLEIPVSEGGEALTLHTWVYGGNGVSVDVTCRGEQGPVALTNVERRLVAERIDLAPCAPSRPGLSLLFQAENASSGLHLVMDKLTVSQGRDASPLFPATAWFLAFVIGLSVAAPLVPELRDRWVLSTSLVSAAAAVLLLGTPISFKLALALHAPILLVLWWRGDRRHRSWAVPLVLFSLALTVCWQQLLIVDRASLPPDSLAVLQLAAGMNHFYDTGVREPLWVWISWLLGELTGQPAIGLQVFSVLSSALLAPLGFGIATAVLRSRSAGVFCGLFLAIHPHVVAESTTGLRTPFNAAVLAALVLSGFVRPRALRWILCSICVSLAAAIQLTSVSVAALVLILIWWHRRSWREFLGVVVAPMVFAALVMAPHFVNSQEQFGDPLWSLNVHATFYRNYEFVTLGEGGCPGCPTREEMQERGSYAGRHLTMREYIFGMHTPREVLERIARGYWLVYGKPTSRYLASLIGWSGPRLYFLYALYLSGIALLLWRRAWLVLVPLFGALGMTAFIASVGMDSRLAMTPVVFVAVAGAAVPGLITDRVLRRLKANGPAFVRRALEGRIEMG